MSTQIVESSMVIRELRELPDTFKFLQDFIPPYGTPVKVIDHLQDRDELYLCVSYNNSKAVLNVRHFRTVAQHKLRIKLLNAKARSTNVEKLLKTL